MSLTYTQTIALIDDTVGSNAVSYPVADKTRDINLALDRALAIIFDAAGTWQFDDINHSGFPEITANIVSGTRRYAFTADANSILTLDIFRVFIKNADGIYQEIFPIDQQSDQGTENFSSGQDVAGIPNRYDKTGKWIDLDPVPNYNSTAGIKCLINREASYFTTADTTKKAGIAGIFHEYLALRPAYQYAYRHSLESLGAIRDEMLRIEVEMEKYYATRERDSRNVLAPRITEFR